jgi:uncharacterized protein YcfJ
MKINRSITMFSIRLSRLPIVAAVLAALPVQAADYTDTARVVSSTPIIERVREPRQECSTEAPPPRAPQVERSVMAPIIGGVAGALLGSTVGRGSGRDAATAAGAIAGAIVGDRVSNPDSDRSLASSVVGGAAGGLLGAQVGQGNGRTAAAAAGAIFGAVAGDRVDNRVMAEAPIQRCRTVETVRETTRGYTVVYHYNGRDVSTTLPYDPGPTVRVGVSVIGSDNVAVAPVYSVPAPAPRHPGPGRYAAPPGYDYRY